MVESVRGSDHAESPRSGAAERQLGYLRVLEARDPATAPARLQALTLDQVPAVRLETARNPSTPPDALGLLTHDELSMVRWYALRNPRTSGAALRLVADHESLRYGRSRLWVRSLIVHHPELAEAVRAELVAAGACGCPGPCYSLDVFG
jgi:hypothetical protein